MIDVADPVDRRHRIALIVRNRNQRRVSVGGVERAQLRKIEATVQGRHGLVHEAAQERIVQHVDMKVQDVELRRERSHFLEHHDMRRDRVPDLWIEPERDFATWVELCGGAGIAACEQGDVMPLRHEFFCEIGDDPLRSAIRAAAGSFRSGGQSGRFSSGLRNLGARRRSAGMLNAQRQRGAACSAKKQQGGLLARGAALPAVSRTW